MHMATTFKQQQRTKSNESNFHAICDFSAPFLINFIAEEGQVTLAMFMDKTKEPATSK